MNRFAMLFLTMTLAVALEARCADEIVNPVLPGFYSDPSICKGPDGKFHLAVSSLQYFPGIPLFVSEDLVHWVPEGHVFVDPKDLPMFDRRPVTGLFAPTYRHQGGLYHVIVPNNGDRPDGTRDGNLYATAVTPQGPWKIRRANVPAADPSIDFIDGRWRYTATTGHEILYGVFDPETASLVGPARAIWRGTGGIWPEGPHLFKRDGWYYLLIAEGGTQYGHKCVIARSRKIEGPYEGCPQNPILTHARHEAQSNVFQGVGHGDFVETGDGKWWYVFHAFRKQDAKHHLLGRETMLAPVEWREDGWPVVNGGKPISDARTNDERLPARAWTYIRTPDLSCYLIDGDTIRLTAATNTLSDFGSPTFVGTRQTAVRQAFEAVLESADESVGTGLAAYMNLTVHYALVVRQADGRRQAFLRSVLAGKTYEEPPVELPSGPVRLRIEASAKEYRFYAADRLVGVGPARLISAETDDTFGGVLFGLFAEGKGVARFTACTKDQIGPFG